MAIRPNAAREWADRNLERIERAIAGLDPTYEGDIGAWLADFWVGEMPWPPEDNHAVYCWMTRDKETWESLCERFNEKYGVELDEDPDEEPEMLMSCLGTEYPAGEPCPGCGC